MVNLLTAPRVSCLAGAGFLIITLSAGSGPVLAAESGENRLPGAGQAPFRLRPLHGEVTWLADVLARRYGIRVVTEAADRILVLETPDGLLYPVIEDIRGRAFRADKRLRGKQLDLLVRQHEGSPMVQVVRVLEIDKTGTYELDYWCEICAIAMFELKVCDCCQGPVKLRRRLVIRKK